MRRTILILLAIAAVAVVALTLARLHGGDAQPVVVVEDTPAPTRSPADLVALNKAAPVRDGQRIYVPRPGETVPAGSGGSDAQLKIDVNHATASELEALPGIGPTIAARIVRSRGSHPFTRVEELQTRGLVTARVFADIKDLVTTR